ncbi:MAG: sensor histidine kinase [Pseudomonadota bacterium]
MRWLADLSIRTRLALITVLACSLALLLSSIVIITYDSYSYRTQKMGEISAQAGLLAARMSASLEFDDPKAAKEYLEALAANPEMAAAGVYTSSGTLFAVYSRAGTGPPPTFAEPQGQRFEGSEIVVLWPVQLGQRQIGSVYLRASTESLAVRITRYGGITFLAMIASLLITLPIAMRLHYAIANPVYARSLIEASLDPLLTISPDGKITDVNAATVNVTGIGRAELIGTDFSNYFTEPGKAREGYQQVFAQGSVTDFPLTIRHLDGKLTDVLYNASVYKNERGNVLGVFAAARDVTAQKQAEQEIRQRSAELQTANRELEAFSYSVSHDLRAPLRSIDGFSQVLLEDYADRLDEQGRDYLNRIRAATQRMGHLIDDMLALSRVTRAEMQHGIVDLSALAVDVMSELQKSEPERKVTCRIQPGLRASGDARLLHMVLNNLLGNAWKYTARQPQPRIEFDAQHNADGSREFFVRDNGTGFDMAYAGKLFGVFQRLHTFAEFPGTGVGLAIVQRIIHRHGGQVRGSGVPGQGATFYFTLPV